MDQPLKEIFNAAWWKENWPIAAAVGLAIVGLLFLSKKKSSPQAVAVGGLQPSPQAIQAQRDVQMGQIQAGQAVDIESLRQGAAVQIAQINAGRDSSANAARLEASNAANGGANYRATLGFIGASVMPIVGRSLIPTGTGAYGSTGMGAATAWQRMGAAEGTMVGQDMATGTPPSGLPIPPFPSGLGGSGTVDASTPADWASAPVDFAAPVDPSSFVDLGTIV